jgi:serine protease inhibitor
MMKNISILPIIAISMLACTNDETDNNQETSVQSKLKSAQLIKSSNVFGINLLKKTDSLMLNANAFISPFSALQALSMTYNGANGQTKIEMANTLGFSGYSDNEINEYNQSLSAALLEADEKVQLEIANSIWYKLGFEVIPAFININTTYFNAEVKQADFADPQTLIDINNWCKVKTHEKIPTILDEIPGGVVMYLINAIYFKGTWQYEFDKTKTITTSFTKEDGSSVQHSQMSLEAELNYYTTEDFKLVELPYGNGQFNFVMLLPAENQTIAGLIKKLDNTTWDNAINNVSKTKVVVKMPKFKFEFKALLNKPLQMMGMIAAFGPADFSNITPGGGIYISRVIHKTYIDLNEEGTEAAAVTAVEMYKTSEIGDTVKWFVADRPFVYAITEKSTRAILFIGKMMDPTVNAIELE